MSIYEEIDENKRKIAADGYPISLGEVINMYLDGDLDIHPEFQRIYRWTDIQKSKLIESILLGIPLPSFFASQRDDGVWDVVDGLQRLATILSFMGLYKDEYGDLCDPLILNSTKYLPSLQDISWNGENSLPIEVKRDFKRYKLDFKIIKKESSEHAKYDLFQRLNTGGTSLQGQEVRDCLLIMINPRAYEFIKELSEVGDFIACTPMTERKEDERYRHELVLRFFVYKHLSQTKDFKVSSYEDVDSFLSEEMSEIFSADSSFDYEHEKEFFQGFFALINSESSLGENTFKNYDGDSYKGGFILSRYEWLCSFYCSLTNSSEDKLEKIIQHTKNLSSYPEFIDATRHGQRALNRTVKLIQSAAKLEG